MKSTLTGETMNTRDLDFLLAGFLTGIALRFGEKAEWVTFWIAIIWAIVIVAVNWKT
jgi:hypothetical protein